MANPTVEPPEALGISWRDRAVERSLSSARAKAISRSDRFITTAIEILGETGRTDFTVQELVERSKTSLRSFYQHFRSKDELLLALFEEILLASSAAWRTEAAELDARSGLRLIVEKVHGRNNRGGRAALNRALSTYHLQLAEARPTEYARVLLPLRDLILSLIERGISEGVVGTQIDSEALATLMMQALVGAAHMHALQAELTAESIPTEYLWQFIVGGLTGAEPHPSPARAVG